MRILIGLILIIGSFWIADRYDRLSSDLPPCFTHMESAFFQGNQAPESIQANIEACWGKVEYQFPRAPVNAIKYYKNISFVSHFTYNLLTPTQQKILLDLINNPSNFDWGETTWGIEDAQGHFRFFDANGNEIGVFWVDLESGITELKPWNPTVKYGGLSEEGRFKLRELIEAL